MLVLFDNNVPRALRQALIGHRVIEARERGWAELKNGNLLDFAEEAGFDVFVTSDKNLMYQQNLAGRRIALVVLSQGRWGSVRSRLLEIKAAVDAAVPGGYADVFVPPKPRRAAIRPPDTSPPDTSPPDTPSSIS